MTNIKAKKRDLKVDIDSVSVRGFNDLGDEITEEFKTLYRGFMKGKIQLTDNFITKSKQLFSDFDDENRITLSDSYFSNFTFITDNLFDRGQYRIAFRLWNGVIHFVKEWEESSNAKLHKGTPYYFAAASALQGMDFDAALILMHLAFTEDKLNNRNYKETPAYYFLTLNDQKAAHYLKETVDGMIGFLRDRLDGQGNEKGKYKDHYQGTRNAHLTYDQLRQKFLDNDNISDEVRYLFVYSVFRLWRLRVLEKENLGDNIVAPVIFTQVLGIVLVVIEFLLKETYTGAENFGQCFKEIARNESWPLHSLRRINDDRDGNFDNWINGCLNRNSLFGDFSLSYGLRNFVFHTVKSQQKLWREYTKVLQSVWNSFFKTVEIL